MKPLKSQLPLLWVAIANTFQQIHPKSIAKFITLSTANPQILFKNLPQLGKDLDRALETGRFTLTPGTFKKYKGAAYPIFLKEYFKEIFWKEGYIKCDFDLFIVRELRTLCYLFYKFEVPFQEEEKELAYSKFKDIDMMVKTTFTDGQVTSLKEKLCPLLPDDPMDIRPRHSNGATADSFSNSQKRLVRRYIPSLMKVYGLNYFFNGREHAKAWLRTNKLEVHEPNSKVTLVPKDSRGPRIICMEPHERMFIQKGIMHKLYDHIEQQSPARGRVNFTDQTINQKLAHIGSITQEFATIDLKDASDLVSWELVKQVFPSEWVVALEATRSAYADLPSGETVELNKFAPMGSALCFPVEALVFYCIATQVTPQTWVYGDDIIVPTASAVAVMDLLEQYGLLVNRDKSLYRGFFRESCGGDYYKGQNVTPIRCKSVDLESIYALANNLADAFTPQTGEAVCCWYESIMPEVLLRLPHEYRDRANLLAFYTEHNNEYLVCTKRYNAALHKYELRGLGTKQNTKRLHDKNDEVGYDMLFDYFTNGQKGQAPLLDRRFVELERDWDWNPVRHESWYGSTSTVYTDVSSNIGYTRVDLLEVHSR